MKTLGRILIILAAFALVMGITFVMVNVGSASTSMSVPAFAGGDRLPAPDGLSPQFRSGQRTEFHGAGWTFGMIRNVGIVAVIGALIAIPKSVRRKKIRNSLVGARESL